MRKMLLYNFAFMLLFSACENSVPQQNASQIRQEKNTTNESEKEINTSNFINPNGLTLSERILVPKNFQRIKANENSKEIYFRNLPLKPNGSKVLLFNGQEKGNQNAHIAVLKIDVGKKDLQQCADAVMRLHAEYLYNQKRYDEIHFSFTNGFKANYKDWMAGKRISVFKNKCAWVNSYQEGNSYESFREYLEKVFNYAGSLSLSKELTSIPNLNDMKVGDIFIRGGSPGHAVTIMDIAINEKGEKIFLLSQGYMPAQDIQILKNPINENLSPWYSIKEIGQELFTPEYTFDRRELMRF